MSSFEPIFRALNDAGAKYVVVIAAIPDLVAMKRAAARGKDEDDIAALEAIARKRSRP